MVDIKSPLFGHNSLISYLHMIFDFCDLLLLRPVYIVSSCPSLSLVHPFLIHGVYFPPDMSYIFIDISGNHFTELSG